MVRITGSPASTRPVPGTTSDRNRYKLTEQNQRHLGEATIGIAGLSVGNSIAITLALEGVVGHLRLADLDRLDLSNMNRVRAGVHEIGIEKTVLAARQISEFDPYLNISLLREDVTEENIDLFFDGSSRTGPRLDVLIEECDSLYMKFLMREHARARRLPVLMETSDRGMLDVERFDLEPTRPIFHGLVDDVSSSDIQHMELGDRRSREQKIALISRLVGADAISTGAAASLLEVDSSISTWPQLASEANLGGRDRVRGCSPSGPWAHRYLRVAATSI